jgi:DNA polymerase-3 subunit delta
MIYFLHGQDSYRSKKKLQEIVESYKKVHRSGLNLIYFDAKQKEFKDFLDSFKAVSMFSEKKLVILKNLFNNAKFQEDFLEEIKNLEKLKDIIIVFEEAPADQRTKMFKSLQKYAKCQEFKFLQPAMIKKWILAEFEKNNSKIEPIAQDMLLSFVGNNLWQMSNEIKKLSNYSKGEIVRKEDVALLVRPNIENDIFKTIDALSSKNKKQALYLIKKHIDGGDNCLYLLSMIAYQFKNLLIIKELIESKNSYSVISQKSGLHPFVVKKNYSLCNQFSLSQLKKIYQKIFQVDSDIKTGKIEPETALNLLVSEI